MNNLSPLFNITFPRKDICGESGLYFHSSGDIIYDETEKKITLPKGGTVSFDTYFNCFSFAKYLRYTVAENLTVKLVLQGNFTFKLIARRADGKKEILSEVTIDFAEKGEGFFEYDFSGDGREGFYYTELDSLSDGGILYGGTYYTKSLPDETIKTNKTAIVICTYKREEYVYKNMSSLNAFLDNAPKLKEKISIFIVDNAHTIENEKLPHGFVTVFKNKNYGGSGGFTRGMMEAYFRKDEFSHVLLMDDDVVFDAEVINKTLNFLALRKPVYSGLCVGGAMLEIERPYFLYEAAGKWTGRKVKNLNNGLDLRNTGDVFKNEKPFKADYNAWWYMCMPLTLADKHGFPFPFFIKGDDIEYGLRAAQDIAFFSGVAVWHVGFEKKNLGHFEYYIKRNEAVINALYRRGALKEIFKLFLYTGRKIVKRQYILAELGFKAYNDFLKGTDFFLKTDAESYNAELKNSYQAGIGKRGFLRCCLRFVGTALKLLFCYRKAVKDYKNNIEKVTNLKFWQNHLELGGIYDTMGQDKQSEIKHA